MKFNYNHKKPPDPKVSLKEIRVKVNNYNKKEFKKSKQSGQALIVVLIFWLCLLIALCLVINHVLGGDALNGLFSILQSITG